MFSKTAPYYDTIYGFKDYKAEAETLIRLINRNRPNGSKRPPAKRVALNSPHSGGFKVGTSVLTSLGSRTTGRASGLKINHLLDVACGTGQHITHLKSHFQVEGLDLDDELLSVARERHPDITFHKGDMTSFGLNNTYDVMTCLFSSIGYVRTLENLNQAVATMAHHLKPGGLLIIEPWLTPDAVKPDVPYAVFVDDPNLKIARINTTKIAGRLSLFTFHYLIGTPEGTEHLVEEHILGLFTTDEMTAAFHNAELTVTYDPDGLTGRGLYIGKKGELNRTTETLEIDNIII